MRIRHKPNPGLLNPPSAVIDREYEIEVERSTSKLERAYAQAEKRLAKAEERLAKAQAAPKPPKRNYLAQLEAAVELRRAELEEYRRLMVAVAASAEHRGNKSFRPVSFAGPS